MNDWLAGVDENDEEHFTAQALLNYQLGARGLTPDDLRVEPRLLITFQSHIYRHALAATGAAENQHWNRLHNYLFLAHGRYREMPVSIARVPVGAPAAVITLESLIIGGARAAIAVGSAGSLQEYAPLGAAVLPTAAIREEGTSYHYRPPGEPALPDAAAVTALRDACTAHGVLPHEGVVWTTDAPFRELTSKVRRLATEGVVAVDMEASALFIVGAARRLRIASLFIVSDELFHPWNPGFFDRSYRDASVRITESALEALVRIEVSG